jgi:hypothetical protein
VKDLAFDLPQNYINCQSFACTKSIPKILDFCLLSHLVYSQIWLNLLEDDCQFGSILLIILCYFIFVAKFSPLVNKTKGGRCELTKLLFFGYNPKLAIYFF